MHPFLADACQRSLDPRDARLDELLDGGLRDASWGAHAHVSGSVDPQVNVLDALARDGHLNPADAKNPLIAA